MVQLKKGGYAYCDNYYYRGAIISMLVKILSKPESGEVSDQIFEATGQATSSAAKKIVFAEVIKSDVPVDHNHTFNNKPAIMISSILLIPVLKQNIPWQNQYVQPYQK